MRTTQLFSSQLLEGARNCVLNCGAVKAGEKVLILNLVDHCYWPTDELAVQALTTVVQEAGAEPAVLWTFGMEKAYWDEVPRIVLGAVNAADTVISNTKRIMRPQKAIREAMFQRGVVWVRNMATTAQQLSSEWARFPFQLSDEITKQVGDRVDGATTWRITHPNGTDISGKIGDVPAAASGVKRYGEHRKEMKYRFFPPGVFSPVTSQGANGIIVLEFTLPMQAKHLGVPMLRFHKPVKVFVENNRMMHFEGGMEAERLRHFYESLVPHLGEDAWNLCGFHGGINPKARLYESPERFPEAWIEGPHNNPKGIHFHMGGRLTREYDYAFMWHLSCFVGEGATLYIDGEKLYDEGHLTLLDDPEIRRRAAAYGDANSLLWEVPLQG